MLSNHVKSTDNVFICLLHSFSLIMMQFLNMNMITELQIMDRISELPTYWKENDGELQKEFDELKLIDNNLVQFRNELKLGIQTWILLVRLMDVEGSSYLVNKWTALVVDVEGSSSLVDKWIGLAVENGVKGLHIVVESSPHESAYTLPQAIYSAKLLTTLVLNGCRLDEPLIAINLNSLKNLSLQRVSANEQMVHNLIAECCSLEDLSLRYTLGLKFFSVSKAHKLKNMVIVDYSRSSELESIVAPSLQQLTLMCVIVVATCPNLKKLHLSEIVLEDQEFHELISKFPLLEDLSVSSSQPLERVKFSSNLLKRVAFLFCTSLRAVDLDTPNLLSVTFESVRIPTISISASHQCPWNVFFVHEHDVGDIDNWYLKLKEFLGASNQIENLFINLRSVNIRQVRMHIYNRLVLLYF